MSALYKAFAVAKPVFFALILLAAPAMAQPVADPYTVEGVAVDVVAANAVKAREKALVEAQVKAFEKLADTTLSAEDRAAYTIPDADTIMALVKDFEVTNEQLSAKRYKGTFTVRFRPQLAKQYLGMGALQTAQDESFPSQTTMVDPSVQTTTTTTTYQQPAVQPQAPAYQYQPAPVMNGRNVAIRARFNNVQEWVRLKSALDRNSAFGVRRVVALRPKEAIVELAFNGSTGELQQAMSAAGLSAYPAQTVALDTQAPVLDVGFGGYSLY